MGVAGVDTGATLHRNKPGHGWNLLLESLSQYCPLAGSDRRERKRGKEESCATQPVSQRTLSNLLNAHGSLLSFLANRFSIRYICFHRTAIYKPSDLPAFMRETMKILREGVVKKKAS